MDIVSGKNIKEDSSLQDSQITRLTSKVAESETDTNVEYQNGKEYECGTEILLNEMERCPDTKPITDWQKSDGPTRTSSKDNQCNDNQLLQQHWDHDEQVVESDRPPPLDGEWGWMIVVACCLGHFLLVGFSRVLGVFFLPWMNKFGGSAASTAWVQSLFNMARMLFGPLVSEICERWGCRRTVAAGAILYGVGCFGSAFATKLFHLYVTFGVAGAGGAFILTSMFVMINQYFDKKKGIAMGISTMGSGLGCFVLAPVMTVLLEKYGHFGTMLFTSGLALNMFVVSALFRPIDSKLNKSNLNKSICQTNMVNTRGDRIECDSSTCEIGYSHAHSDEDRSRDRFEQNVDSSKSSMKIQSSKSSCAIKNLKSSFVVLKCMPFWLYGFYMAALPCGIQIYMLYTPGMMDERGLSDQQSALVIAISGAADMVGRFMAGFLFDSKLIRTRRWPTHCCFGIGLGVVVCCNAFPKTMTGFIVISVFWGFLEAGYHGQRATVITEFIPPGQVSRMVGFMLFWQGVGTLLSPTFAGYLRDRFGTFRVCFYYGGSSMALCASMFAIYYITRKMKHISTHKWQTINVY